MYKYYVEMIRMGEFQGDQAVYCADEVEAEISSLQAEVERLRLQLQTITNDRDAEQSMKAKARQQRDMMTKKVHDASDLLRIAECYLKTAGHATLATQIGWFLNPASVTSEK